MRRTIPSRRARFLRLAPSCRRHRTAPTHRGRRCSPVRSVRPAAVSRMTIFSRISVSISSSRSSASSPARPRGAKARRKQMDPFVAEIRIFPFNFAPKGWAFCDGQILPLSQNTALFSLLGTTYGGDGKSNFALPNMQGNAPMHPGQGPGLSLHDLGETGGSDTVTLLESEIPSHSHSLNGAPNVALVKLPGANVSMARSKNGNVYSDVAGNLVALNGNTVAPAGGDQPHNNLQPYLT